MQLLNKNKACLPNKDTKEQPRHVVKKHKKRKQEQLQEKATIPDDVSKGKKTKKRKKKKGEEEQHVHQSAGQNKAFRYLQTWNLSQQTGQADCWKFEKCRQIWLLQNAYDATKVPDEQFDVLLKYMSSIRGQMREKAKGK